MALIVENTLYYIFLIVEKRCKIKLDDTIIKDSKK